MANKYYTPSGEPVDLSRARAVQLRAEFASIEQGFALLQVDIDRAVKLRQGETVELLDEPSVRAGGVFAFDSSGNLVVFGKASDASRAGKILGWDPATGDLKYWDYASTITSPVNAAAASATAASASELKASQWADADSGVEVESGRYSAKHWATNAAASAASAAQSENKAAQWAEAGENVEVAPGEYSAKHWARKAAQYAANGVIDDTTVTGVTTWSSSKIDTTLTSTLDSASQIVNEAALEARFLAYMEM